MNYQESTALKNIEKEQFYIEGGQTRHEWNISKDDSMQIKGIAILLMIIHHSFGFSDRLICGSVYSDYLVWAALNCKICVYCFAFLTGYAYHYTRRKTYSESLRRILVLLFAYWVTLLPCLLFAVTYCNYIPTPINISKEFFFTGPPAIMIHNWYVVFFIYAMLTLPLLRILDSRFFAKRKPQLLIFFLFSSQLLPDCLPFASEFRKFFPLVLFGFCFARYNPFHFLRKIYSDKQIFYRYIWHCSFISVLFIFAIYHFSGNHDSLINFAKCFTAIAFIAIIQSILPGFKKIHLKHILSILGKHSMNIWFLHCIVTAVATRHVAQQLFYHYTCPIYVIVCQLAIFLPFSMMLLPIQTWCRKLLEKL